MEAVTPDTREQLNEILDALRVDREKGWQMQPDGTYVLEEDNEGTSSQEALYRYFSKRKVSLYEPQPEVVPAAVSMDSPAAESKSGLFGWLRRLIKS